MTDHSLYSVNAECGFGSLRDSYLLVKFWLKILILQFAVTDIATSYHAN